jgi:hypothetical protein
LLSLWIIITALTPLNPIKLTAKPAEKILDDLSDQSLVVNGKIELPFAKNNRYNSYDNSYELNSELHYIYTGNRMAFYELLSDRSKHKFDSLISSGKRSYSAIGYALTGLDADSPTEIGLTYDTTTAASSDTSAIRYPENYYKSFTVVNYDIKGYSKAYNISMMYGVDPNSGLADQVTDEKDHIQIKYTVDKVVKVPKSILIDTLGKFNEQGSYQFAYEGVNYKLIIQQVNIQALQEKPKRIKDFKFTELNGLLLTP